MFIVPTFDSLQLKRFPWATVLLIICCSWAFFFLQQGDDKRIKDVICQSAENGLMELERGAYVDFKRLNSDKEGWLTKSKPLIRSYGETAGLNIYYRWTWHEMRRDVAFQNALMAQEIVTPETHYFELWQELRSQEDEALKDVIDFTYSFRTAWPTWLTSLTHMFLHADFYHLLGNMVFLLLAGTLLEAVIGSLSLTLVYLVAGVLESWFTISFLGESAVPCLGASGAICGIMGCYALVLGFTRIPVFVSFGFYFSNMRLPALVILLFWSLKELISYNMYENSHVNYMAHFGGYLVGAVAGLPLKVWRGVRVAELFGRVEGAEENLYLEHVEKGRKSLEELNYDKARDCFVEALKTHSKDIAVYRYLFAIDRQKGVPKQFKETAEKLLQLLLLESGSDLCLIRYYREYAASAKVSNLSTSLLHDLVRRFLKNSYIDEAMDTLQGLLINQKFDDQLPGTLFMSAWQFREMGHEKYAMKFATTLFERFPDHPEVAQLKEKISTSPHVVNPSQAR